MTYDALPAHYDQVWPIADNVNAVQGAALWMIYDPGESDMVDETKALATQLTVGSAALGLPVSKLVAKTLVAMVEADDSHGVAMPDEGVKLITAFVKIPDRACRDMVLDIVQAIAGEPPLNR